MLSRSDILQALNRPALLHERFGNLRHYNAVTMPRERRCVFPGATEPLFIHLTATLRCTARCKGCINAEITLGETSAEELESDPLRDARAIAELVRRDGADEVVVCLYGGEPLLVPERLTAIMNALDGELPECRVRYMLYTNGERIAEAISRHPRLQRDVWLYSVSIDGQARQHNAVRRGTDLARVETGLRALQSEGFRGEVLMWSTLREGQSLHDCFRQFRSLKEEGLADHWFWHWLETEENFSDLAGAAAAYETDLRHILECYSRELEGGRLLSIPHLSELVLYALSGHERGSSACGVEKARNYDLIGGTVQACADLPAEYRLGSIAPDGSLEIEERNLAALVAYKEVLGCPNCGIHAYCGGRCPVQAVVGTAERLLDYCQLLRLHVGVVLEFLPRIEAAMEANGISAQALYERSAHIAQYTDVTP